MNSLFKRAYGSARFSPARLETAAAVLRLDGAFTVEELVSEVRSADAAAGATATVYRAVTAMEAAGFLERVGERAGSALYAHCEAHAHHHHVVCDGCGRIAATACPLGAEAVHLAGPEGFVITRHEVTLYGLCPECASTSEQGSC